MKGVSLYFEDDWYEFISADGAISAFVDRDSKDPSKWFDKIIP